MELVKPENAYVISIGPMVIPYFSRNSIREITEELVNLVISNKAFYLEIDKNGPLIVINPAPGMVIVVMTKEQFERNRGIQQIIGRA